MQKLVDALSAPAADRRAKPRFQPTFGTTCRLLQASPQRGLVWDISIYGVGLLLPVEPAPGEVIPIELLTESGAAPISVPIQVVYRRKLSTGDYFVGARFERTLTEAEVEPLIAPVLAKPYLGVKVKPKGPKRRIGRGESGSPLRWSSTLRLSPSEPDALAT